MARKKIILVIVEGPSDEDALGVILTRFFSSNEVHLCVTHTDITTKDFSVQSEIVKTILGVISKYLKSNGFKKSDLSKVIHIVDTDGAFIPDDSVIENDSITRLVYSTTNIYANNVENIRKRNAQKSANLSRISMCNIISGIPYQVYYMSCNLDHVLYNKMNSTDEEKEQDSYTFAKHYKDRLDDFLSFISESDFSVSGSYTETWSFIKQELHSLERHTNFGLCFQT